ncbi:dUTP diphosphatase [bacterium]|nr:dUTP diphosphatase [candidate division CSSED10-310 bacterium]
MAEGGEPREPIRIELLRLSFADGLELPRYMTPGAAGMDLYAAIHNPLILPPGQRTLVPCGFRMAIPLHYEAQIRPRSGLALRHGVTVLNSPGTIDADYRGDVRVLLVNFGTKPFVINRGDRIAQMVVAPVARIAIVEVAELSETTRGDGGFGHTG